MSGTRYWIDGSESAGLDPGNRALHYGDGVFETFCVRAGVPAYLDTHFQRLKAGCARLQLAFDDWSGLESEIRRRAQESGEAVLKVILARGAGARGYRFDPAQAVTRIVSSAALPVPPSDHATQGVRVRLCDLRLGLQPALAGIKHLNRLEQVLARAEWRDEYAEGLMLDCNGALIEGTMSNLFLVRDSVLLTPRLDGCGVAGVMRSVLIELAARQGIEVQRRQLLSADLATVDELFVCNSLIGIWPVVAVGERFAFGVGAVTQRLQHALSHDDGCRGVVWYNE